MQWRYPSSLGIKILIKRKFDLLVIISTLVLFPSLLLSSRITSVLSGIVVALQVITLSKVGLSGIRPSFSEMDPKQATRLFLIMRLHVKLQDLWPSMGIRRDIGKKSAAVTQLLLAIGSRVRIIARRAKRNKDGE